MNTENSSAAPLLAPHCRPRPAYKSRAEFWRMMFLGCLALLTALGFILGQSIRGNVSLQKENAALRQGFDPDKSIITITPPEAR